MEHFLTQVETMYGRYKELMNMERLRNQLAEMKMPEVLRRMLDGEMGHKGHGAIGGVWGVLLAYLNVGKVDIHDQPQNQQNNHS